MSQLWPWIGQKRGLGVNLKPFKTTMCWELTRLQFKPSVISTLLPELFRLNLFPVCVTYLQLSTPLCVCVGVLYVTLRVWAPVCLMYPLSCLAYAWNEAITLHCGMDECRLNCAAVLSHLHPSLNQLILTLGESHRGYVAHLQTATSLSSPRFKRLKLPWWNYVGRLIWSHCRALLIYYL